MNIDPIRIMEFARQNSLSFGVAALAMAAESRGVHWKRGTTQRELTLVRGELRKSLKAATTSETSRVAIRMVSNKRNTASFLASHGLPVPAQVVVHSEEEAVAAAEKIGFPVVIKPLRGNHGRGVTVGVRLASEAVVAFAKAALQGKRVLIESYIPGDDHRLLVVNGVLVAAARRIPGQVVGNGVDTIAVLIEALNKDPRRGLKHKNVLTRIVFDQEATRLLKQQGYTRESVPDKGQTVVLRSFANLSAGGTSLDVTDHIHEDNRRMAESAIGLIGLDIGGVDFLTNDISKSYRERGGAICEINSGPGLRMHLAPTEGSPRDVVTPIIDMLFPISASSLTAPE